MEARMLETVEVQTGKQPQGSVIWLHGLGADGHDFEPIVPELVRRDERALRFVFPHAPLRPVTLNGGMKMRAWFDIVGLDRTSPQDRDGIVAAQAEITALIEREIARGIASTKIVLAGFSQGGALAVYVATRYPKSLAGILGLSCLALLATELARERTAASLQTPVLLAHGTQDPVVACSLGADQRALLERHGYVVEWHTYPMPHAVSTEEIADIARWLRRIL
jgi:phospholipase/carboxylesterase